MAFPRPPFNNRKGEKNLLDVTLISFYYSTEESSIRYRLRRKMLFHYGQPQQYIPTTAENFIFIFYYGERFLLRRTLFIITENAFLFITENPFFSILATENENGFLNIKYSTEYTFLLKNKDGDGARIGNPFLFFFFPPP